MVFGVIVFDWEWMNLFVFMDWFGFMEVIFFVFFIYWGWDICFVLNEEIKDFKWIFGCVVLLIMVILLVIYVVVMIVVMMYVGLGEDGMGLGNEVNVDDFFFVIKDGLFGLFGWVFVVFVIIFVILLIQMIILFMVWGILVMGVYWVFLVKFKDVYLVYKMLLFFMIVMGVVVFVYYVGMILISDNILQDLIFFFGFVIVFYYVIIGFVCVWYFCRDFMFLVCDFFFKGLFLLLGGFMFIGVFIQFVIDMWDVDYGYMVLFGIGGMFVIGVGLLVFGFVLMFFWYFFLWLKWFFCGESLNCDIEVMVLDEFVVMICLIDGGI